MEKLLERLANLPGFEDYRDLFKALFAKHQARGLDLKNDDGITLFYERIILLLEIKEDKPEDNITAQQAYDIFNFITYYLIDELPDLNQNEEKNSAAEILKKRIKRTLSLLEICQIALKHFFPLNLVKPKSPEKIVAADAGDSKSIPAPNNNEDVDYILHESTALTFMSSLTTLIPEAKFEASKSAQFLQEKLREAWVHVTALGDVFQYDRLVEDGKTIRSSRGDSDNPVINLMQGLNYELLYRYFYVLNILREYGPRDFFQNIPGKIDLFRDPLKNKLKLILARLSTKEIEDNFALLLNAFYQNNLFQAIATSECIADAFWDAYFKTTFHDKKKEPAQSADAKKSVESKAISQNADNVKPQVATQKLVGNVDSLVTENELLILLLSLKCPSAYEQIILLISQKHPDLTAFTHFWPAEKPSRLQRLVDDFSKTKLGLEAKGLPPFLQQLLIVAHDPLKERLWTIMTILREYFEIQFVEAFAIQYGLKNALDFHFKDIHSHCKTSESQIAYFESCSVPTANLILAHFARLQLPIDLWGMYSAKTKILHKTDAVIAYAKENYLLLPSKHKKPRNVEQQSNSLVAIGKIIITILCIRLSNDGIAAIKNLENKLSYTFLEPDKNMALLCSDVKNNRMGINNKVLAALGNFYLNHPTNSKAQLPEAIFAQIYLAIHAKIFNQANIEGDKDKKDNNSTGLLKLNGISDWESVPKSHDSKLEKNIAEHNKNRLRTLISNFFDEFFNDHEHEFVKMAYIMHKAHALINPNIHSGMEYVVPPSDTLTYLDYFIKSTYTFSTAQTKQLHLAMLPRYSSSIFDLLSIAATKTFENCRDIRHTRQQILHDCKLIYINLSLATMHLYELRKIGTTTLLLLSNNGALSEVMLNIINMFTTTDNALRQMQLSKLNTDLKEAKLENYYADIYKDRLVIRAKDKFLTRTHGKQFQLPQFGLTTINHSFAGADAKASIPPSAASSDIATIPVKDLTGADEKGLNPQQFFKPPAKNQAATQPDKGDVKASVPPSAAPSDLVMQLVNDLNALAPKSQDLYNVFEFKKLNHNHAAITCYQIMFRQMNHQAIEINSQITLLKACGIEIRDDKTKSAIMIVNPIRDAAKIRQFIVMMAAMKKSGKTSFDPKSISQFKQAKLKHLLAMISYGESPDLVKKMIEENPDLLFEKLEEKNAIITRSSQPFANKTPYQMALAEDDIQMAEMIKDQLILVADERVAYEQYLEQLRVIEKSRYILYKALNKLNTVIKDSKPGDIILSSSGNPRLKTSIADALSQFRLLVRTALKEITTTGMPLIPDLLSVAIKSYRANYNDEHIKDPRALLVWRKIIGWIEHFLPTNYIQALCDERGLYGTRDKLIVGEPQCRSIEVDVLLGHNYVPIPFAPIIDTNFDTDEAFSICPQGGGYMLGHCPYIEYLNVYADFIDLKTKQREDLGIPPVINMLRRN